MACLLTNGYSLPCKGIAGVSEVYIGTWNGSSLTYTTGTVSGSANGIVSFGGATVSFYKFQQTIETGSLTLTGNYNEQNGTAYYDQVAEITVHDVNQSLVDQVNTLGQGRWRVIVLDKNGRYFLLGKTSPVSVTALTGGLGKAFGDLNGYTITFTGKELSNLTEVSSAAALSVITN